MAKRVISSNFDEFYHIPMHFQSKNINRPLSCKNRKKKMFFGQNVEIFGHFTPKNGQKVVSGNFDEF